MFPQLQPISSGENPRRSFSSKRVDLAAKQRYASAVEPAVGVIANLSVASTHPGEAAERRARRRPSGNLKTARASRRLARA